MNFLFKFLNMRLLFLWILFLSLVTFAQTKVSGVVLDIKKQPVPFSNVAFKDGKGVQTDENGKFVLESTKTYDIISASLVGYIQKNVKLTESDTKNLIITLLEESNQLTEVIILKKPKKHLGKKENPAYKILKGIWANKKRNGLSLVKRYEYKKYSSISIGLSNLDSLFMKKLLGKSYDSVIHIVEKNDKLKKYFVPVYMKETNEAFFGNTILHKEKIDKLAERSIGVGQEGFLFKIEISFSYISISEKVFVILSNKNPS